jgi:L-asparaginase II
VSAAPPVLVEVVRNGVLESCHRGSFVFLDPDGAHTWSAGSPEAPAFPRSALKPLQAVAMIEAGYPGRAEALAIAAASHDGNPAQLDVVRAILRASDSAQSHLQCPAALPSGERAMIAHLRAGGGPQRICHNCSGKHAAMLATCAVNGWSQGSYCDPAHPLQRAAADAVETFTGERIARVAVDGCGAPAYAVSLVGVARAFGRLATAPAGSASAAVREAMRANPMLIGGTGRAVSELSAAVPGLLCKDGAEGVWGAALPDGRAFAAKVEDGGMRTLGPVLCAALRHWDIDGAVVQRWSAVPVLGGGEPVGEIRWAFAPH